MEHDPVLRGFFHDDSIFKKYLDRVVESTEAPLRYHCAAILSALGIVVGRRAVMQTGIYGIYPITPVILVGPSGVGKTQAIQLAQILVREVTKGQVPRRKGAADDKHMGSKMWLLADEATPQAIIRAFTLTPWGDDRNEDTDPAELAIIAGEMATFMSRSGEKEGMIPVLTKLLEQPDEYSRLLVKDMTRGDRKQDITYPTTSFMAGTTIEWMRKLMPSEMFSGGFFRRCIMVKEERKGQYLPNPKRLDAGELRKMAERWEKTLFRSGYLNQDAYKGGIWRSKTIDFKSSENYWAKWGKIHHERRPGDARLVGHHNALPQTIQRTAMCFAVARQKDKVEPQDLKEAEAFILSLLGDLHEVLLQSEVHGFADYCQLLHRLLINQQHSTESELRTQIKCPGAMFEDLLEWSVASGLAKRGGTKKAPWVELANKGMTSWGTTPKKKS